MSIAITWRVVNESMRIPAGVRRGAEWVALHRERIFLLVGVLLVGALAFESGFLRGAMMQTEPVVISLPAVTEGQSPQAEAQVTQDTTLSGVERAAERVSAGQGAETCRFVGSRNSDKYHLASCAVVKRIKPENKVCFASEEDAKRRGYVAGCVK